MTKTSAFIFLALVSQTCTYAQNVPAGAASAEVKPQTTPIRVRTISLRPTDPEYLPELVAKGVQGKAEVLVSVGPDGAPKDLSVSKTSRSNELDAAAIKVVRELKFSAPQGDNRPLQTILVPVKFLRDSISTLPKKTCSEFNTDVQYYRSTFPEEEIGKMSVINMTIGVLVLSASQQGLGDIASASRKASAAGKHIVDACAITPDAMYFQLFRDIARKSGT